MPSVPIANRRNFCIIAHIDHGKSTLADRIIQLTGGLDEREMREQVLDSMDLERERGITIKASSVRLYYRARDGQDYVFNLIDTPGHVDFYYEVSRALAACDGAVLVVDAAQGVQAQTLANVYAALDANLEVIPVINKIDLPNAQPGRVKKEIEEIIGLDAEGAVACSAKTGEGVAEILETIVKRIPPPRGNGGDPLQALVFDSWYDTYQGVVMLVRVVSGCLKKNDEIRLMGVGKKCQVQQVGAYSPRPIVLDELSVGDVGFVVAGVKNISDAKIGDTITHAHKPCAKALAGFRNIKPVVFSGLYPILSKHYEVLKEALEKLRLNDSSFSYEPETSAALGFGFRCGFLGMLHMEIVHERLEREYELELITTAPTVIYRIHSTDGQILTIDNPSKMPDAGRVDFIEEPFVKISIHMPREYIGNIIQLCESRRGIQQKIDYVSSSRVVIHYEMPFPEIMFDFYDRLKSLTKGYASLDYEMAGYRRADLVKLNMLINGEVVDALSIIVHRDSSYYRGRALVEKLQKLIPRQQFEVAIQAAVGSRVIARQTVKAMRKDVTAKCYGGDITRKRKLLEKQKEGKKRLKQVGRVEIPQEAFLAVLKIE